MEFNIADLFEAVADTVPGNEALVCAGGGGVAVRWSYAELEQRANRMASVLVDRGIGAGDHVGLHLHNGSPYIVGMLALYKIGAVPVNVNYRYVAEELQYLFDDADLTAVITEPDLAPIVDRIQNDVPRLAHVLVADGLLDRELAAASTARPDAGPRSADDLYLLYTGGTTGMPKGVMWRHEDIYFASLGGRGTPSRGVPALRRPEELVDRVRKGDPIMRRLPLCPLMHGGAMWVALQTHLNGGCLVLSTDRHFDAAAALRLMAGERVELIMLIGDATARPIADELGRAPSDYDLSPLAVIASGGAIMAPAVKSKLRELLPGTAIVDTYGASETGGQGRLGPSREGEAPRLITDADTVVFDDEWKPIAPGSGTVGRLARTGHIPLGYYNDPDKTAATFPVIGGRRWSVPGDLAAVEADGSIVVFGRGAMTINTGGEKVFPEEVEGAIKSHPSVFDALVVGIPDERFGQQVCAVVAVRDGEASPTADELTSHARGHLASYKVPRRWVFVDHCQRSPTGKPDYQWAAAVVEKDAATRDETPQREER
ncbi:MAG: acyl-CoA synthetase [Actinobacteria bacterium]|nr:acyl-CoA synthetase [Actinomycetota bacterium]